MMPQKTKDGRPFERGCGPDEIALWMPEPPKDGDDVFCQGTIVGTFHGPPGGMMGDGKSYITTIPLAEMPVELAAYFRQCMAASEEANRGPDR